MRTRIFKCGNFLAIRIPRDLAVDGQIGEAEIERVGNALMVRPVSSKSLAGIGAVIAKFSPDFMAGGRESHPERALNRVGEEGGESAKLDDA